MKAPEIPHNEPERLEALREYEVLDTAPEKAFDDLTWLACRIADVPIALVSLVDEHRQWFKSRQGLEACETGRDISFCGHAVFAETPLLVPDALEDPRFADNPLVTGPPHIRFYYGVPLTNARGESLGTLCVIDRTARSLDEEQKRMLGVIATQVLSQLELRLAARRLREASARANQANQAKSRFLANMSHEIRTPMNAVLAMTELALATDLSEEQRGYLETVNDSAESLLRLLNDILDFSKVEAGKLDFERISFDLMASIRTMLRSQTPAARQKGLELRLQIDPELPAKLVGDPVRLNQVLLNLVSNAIKFTDHGHITVEVGPAQARDGGLAVDFQVRDTGIGIPTHRQQAIFDAFSQADASTTRFYGGTGLGLAISARLVNMMGGRIRVESRPGGGSRFSFQVLFGLHTEAGNTPGTAESVSPPEPSGSASILVVDDVPVNRLVAEKMLSKLGHRVAVAEDGEQALALLRERPFDIVLMDVEMPGMDGIETTAAIRRLEHEGHHGTPVIAMTGHDMKGDRERCLQAGMVDYLTKPIRQEALREVVERVLSVSGKG